MRPLLSICIPTFNRAAFIGETLDSLTSQITDEVEIVIVDGGSTDHTEDVIRARAGGDPRLKYLRQERNGGVDRDMDHSVRAASGRYCWLMSSDDLVRPGAISRVLDECRADPDLLIVNSEIRNFDMSTTVRKRVLRIDEDVAYGSADRERFFIAVGAYLSYMACVVIRRELWLARVRDWFYGTEFISLGVVLEQGIPERTKVIAQPLVSIRYGNFTWAPRSFEISLFKWPTMIWALPYRDQVKLRVCPNGGWRELPRLLYHRALGGFGRREAARYVDRNGIGGLRRWIAYGICVLPARMVNAVAIGYYSIRRDSEDTLYMLRTCTAYWRRT